MNESQELRAALDELTAATKRESALEAEVSVAHKMWVKTGNFAHAPTTELHERWKAARRATEDAWGRMMTIRDKELRR